MMNRFSLMSLVAVALAICSACGIGGGGSKSAGSEGGPCYPNGTCDVGLSCLSQTCVNVGGMDALGNAETDNLDVDAMPELGRTEDVVEVTDTNQIPDGSIDLGACDSIQCACTTQSKKDCCGSSVCWFDSCGHVGEKLNDCPYGCMGGACAKCPTADCTGKECGDDGCGGNCGTCNTQDTCDGLMWNPPTSCQNGHCVGAAVQNCEDQNPCTTDSCVPGQGCTYQESADGQTCIIGSCSGLVWTQPGACKGGKCQMGDQQSCDDGYDCTTDSCSSLKGCASTLKPGYCLLGGCYQSGEALSSNACKVCNSASPDSWAEAADETSCGYGLWCQGGACVCKPDCTGKQCGNDGCGGICSPGCTGNKVCSGGQCVCGPNDHLACSGGDLHWFDSCGSVGALIKACQYGCSDGACSAPGVCTSLPSTWAVVSRVTTLQTPGDTTVQTRCPDYSGDGKGDNGLKGLAGTLNPEIKKALDGGTCVAIFEYKGVSNFTNTPAFTLGGMTGQTYTTGGSSYLIDPVSYDQSCQNVDRFSASIVQGKLTGSTGALMVQLFSFLGGGGTGIDFPMNLENVLLTADVTGSEGSMTNGVLAGVWQKAEADAQMAHLDAECQKSNPPSICSYVSVMKSFLPMLFDLDLDKDGVKDAATVCMMFTTGPATISGYIQ